MLCYAISFIVALCASVSTTEAFFEKKPDIFIVIHGTWASPNHWFLHKTPQWYEEGNPSFETLKQTCNAPIKLHTWSGKNHLTDRIKGARELADKLQVLARGYAVHIIAHSHGGNVALLAMGYLAEEKAGVRIEELILLGTPIHVDWYEGCFHVAKRIYNIFSYGDVIQPVSGMYERVLPEHNHIYNIQLKLNGSCPTHQQLHHKEVLRHITKFDKIFAKKDIYCLHCKDDQEPVITPDTDRINDIEIDKKFTQQLVDSWTDIRDRYADKSQETNNRLTRLRDRWTQYCKKTAARLYTTFSLERA